MNKVINGDTVNGGMAGVVDMADLNKAKGGRRRNDHEKKRRKNPMNSRALKQHLKYLVPEIRLALIKEEAEKAPMAIKCPEDIHLFIEPLRHYAEENFVSLHLNAKFEVVGHQIISRGTVSAALVHPREVFKAAIVNNSYALIVAHNHPAGSLTPSAEDIETTRQLIKAAQIIGITLLDHVIVASTGLYSLRENRPELWN